MYTVLVTEWATDGAHLVGHTKSYEQVLLPGRADLLGHMVEVRISRVGKFFMEGELLDDAPRPPLPGSQVTRHVRGRREEKGEGEEDLGEGEKEGKIRVREKVKRAKGKSENKTEGCCGTSSGGQKEGEVNGGTIEEGTWIVWAVLAVGVMAASWLAVRRWNRAL